MRLTFGELPRSDQRTAWASSLIMRLQPQLTFERYFPRPEYLPLPWYGRVRQWLARPARWLSGVLEDWSVSMDRLADRVNYRQRTKPTTKLWAGDTVQFRRYEPLGRHVD